MTTPSDPVNRLPTPDDFNSMSPRELRIYANEHEIDTSSIDARRKSELVALLTAWRDGEPFEPAAEPEAVTEASKGQPDLPDGAAEQIVEHYGGTVIDDSVSKSEFYESDEDPAKVEAAFEAGDGGVTTPPESEPVRREAARAEAGKVEVTPVGPVEPRDFHLEPLELADLVEGDNRVRIVLNTFPVVVNGEDLCRLMLVQVPGESGTLAVVWWKNFSRGPRQMAPIARVASRSKDSETGQNIVTTTDGDQIRYHRSTGCTTCGNRLAHWRPWKAPVRMVQVAKW